MQQPNFDQIDWKALSHTHDCRLPNWGPYSKKQAGIAHICDKNRGKSFNLSVFPAQYRGKLELPNELYQSNFYPWQAKADLSEYTYRFEVEWKDQVFADISYIKVQEDSYVIYIRCVNNTDLKQNICLHFLASMQYPASDGIIPIQKQIKCDRAYSIIDAAVYTKIELASHDFRDGLTYDGRFLCEQLGSGMTNGRGLGGRFGKTAGDRVTYCVSPVKFEKGYLILRALGHAVLQINGMAEGVLTVDSSEFALYQLPVANLPSEGEIIVTCITGSGVLIDSIVLTDTTEVTFVDEELNIVPTSSEQDHSLILDYGNDLCYGIMWQGEDHVVREFYDSNWDMLMKRTVSNHVTKRFSGDGKEHYTDLFIRPVFLEEHSESILFGGVTFGNREIVLENIERFQKYKKDLVISSEKNNRSLYTFSQQIMKATLMTNVVYPVYIQGNYIKHFTPGKLWDSLYTWDSGFIALAMTAFAPQNALDCLNCYLTEVGNQSAFIHHGSPVPVQAYVYKALWDLTQDKKYLAALYPRMKQYYEFLIGRNPASETRLLKSGLINTFRYFYNSGGWDDYPPQEYVQKNNLSASTAPIVSSAHAINFARILKNAAKILGLSDGAVYEADIQSLTESIQTYAYDKESGYFGYVLHDAEGNPYGLLRDENGVNMNMGMDGAYPLVAGICNPEQEKTLVEYFMDEHHMWTDIGISTVDKSAPYYRNDGYWNGAVWMAHQWFVYLSMLEYGYDENAYKIAKTALNTWKREVDASYNSYEHFIVGSGRGAGWHHFGALSSPVVLWYHAYCVPGTLTVSTNTWVLQQEFSFDRTKLEVTLFADLPIGRTCSAVVVMAPERQYTVTINGVKTNATYQGDAIPFHIPGGVESVVVVEMADSYFLP